MDQLSGTDQDSSPRLRYRVLTGPDDSVFCQRVSDALDDGYRLHGGPAATFNGDRVIVAQALILAESDSGDESE